MFSTRTMRHATRTMRHAARTIRHVAMKDALFSVQCTCSFCTHKKNCCLLFECLQKPFFSTIHFDSRHTHTHARAHTHVHTRANAHAPRAPLCPIPSLERQHYHEILPRLLNKMEKVEVKRATQQLAALTQSCQKKRASLTKTLSGSTALSNLLAECSPRADLSAAADAANAAVGEGATAAAAAAIPATSLTSPTQKTQLEYAIILSFPFLSFPFLSLFFHVPPAPPVQYL